MWPFTTARQNTQNTEEQREVLLPTTHRRRSSGSGHSHSPRKWSSFCRRTSGLRRLLLWCAGSVLLLFLLIFRANIPPSFDDIRSYERNLPQHNLSEALHDPNSNPPGPRKYMRVVGGAASWPIVGGFNNVLEEILVSTYIANRAGRAFVFEDYVWARSQLPYYFYDRSLKPAQVPLNAFISGASAGGVNSDDGSTTLRSISIDFFDVVCPDLKRIRLSSRDAPTKAEDGMVLIDWWLEQLKITADHPCVELDFGETGAFNWEYFGSTRTLDLLPHLKASPTLKYWSWSPLVLSAIARNFAVFQPLDSRVLLDSHVDSTIGGSHHSDASYIGGLVAIHLRRGDYRGHCHWLGRINAPYLGINTHPSIIDRFDPSNNRDPEEFRRHCFPNVELIAERLRQIRSETNRDLKRVYLSSNGWGPWIGWISEALKRDGWMDVITAADLVLDAKQSQVSMAVDAAIAEKAEVFVGNGFSSLTGNIMLLRLAKDMMPETNRLL